MRDATLDKPAILTPKAHQIGLSLTIAVILARSAHAYLEAPTGTGKTLAIALAGEQCGPDLVIYLTHSIDIQNQVRKDFDSFAAQGHTTPGRWHIMTWQLFCSAAKSGRLEALIGTANPPLVFVDECHFGGTATDMAKTSFQMIRATAQKVCWVSATPWDLDEKTLGRRHSFTAVLTMEDAYRNKLLNPVDIVRVDCGLHIRAAVDRLERSTGLSFSTIASRTVDINQQDAEQTYQELAAEIRQLTGRSLTLADVAPILRHRFRLMADLYLAHHKSERAMFWLPNRSLARECADYLTRRLPGAQHAAAIVDAEGLAYEAEMSAKAIADFQDVTSPLRVACVVYRLREGFDSRPLRLGFDCSWSPKRLRIAVQKIGRLTRTDDHKPTSQYYYAVDVKTVAGIGSEKLNPAYLAAVQQRLETSPSDAEFAGEAIIESRALSNAVGGDRQHSDAHAKSEILATSDAHVHTLRTPLFAFDSVDGFKVIDSATLARTYIPKSSAADRFAQLITDFERGIIKERGISKSTGNSAAYRRLRACCIKGTADYDGDIAERLKACAPGLVKRWNDLHALANDKGNLRRKRETYLVGQILGGKPRPASTSCDGQILRRALSRSGTYARPDLVQKLEKAGLFEAKAARADRHAIEKSENIARIVGAIEQGGKPPPQGTVDRRRLSGWLSPFGPKTNDEVRRRIARCRPDLMPKGISADDRDQARAEKLADVRSLMIEHGFIPIGKLKVLWHARRLFQRKTPGSDVLIAELETLLPGWRAYTELLNRWRMRNIRPNFASALTTNAQIAETLHSVVLLQREIPSRRADPQQREAIDYIESHIDEWRKYPALVKKLAKMAQRNATHKRDSLKDVQLMMFGNIHHPQPESQRAL
jgi:superfamily II DNA or RNA helicase